MFDEELERIRGLSPDDRDVVLDELLKLVATLLEDRRQLYAKSASPLCERCPLRN